MINELLKRIAQALDRQKIPYMIIGGQAVLLYGSPRLTRDIDITLGVDTDFYEKILKLCAGLKLKVLPKNPGQFVKNSKVLPTEDSRSKIRVDFIFSNTSYEQEAIRRAKKVTLQGKKISFVSLEDLIIHKMFAGRAIDLEDVRTILIKQKSVDFVYIRRWLKEFSKLKESAENPLTTFDRLRKKA